MQIARRIAAFLPLLCVAAATLAGCKMIDQTLFRPDPEPGEEAAPPPGPATPRPVGAASVLTIRYDSPNPDYQTALGQAVRAVEQRRPGAIYDVVAISTAAETAQAAKDAGAVLAAMKDLGIPNNRLNLGARIDPSANVREVRLYLR